METAIQGIAGKFLVPGKRAPQLLISLWVYAYSRGIGSAREVAGAVNSIPRSSG
jgi:hypothetical protein